MDRPDSAYILSQVTREYHPKTFRFGATGDKDKLKDFHPKRKNPTELAGPVVFLPGLARRRAPQTGFEPVTSSSAGRRSIH